MDVEGRRGHVEGSEDVVLRRKKGKTKSEEGDATERQKDVKEDAYVDVVGVRGVEEDLRKRGESLVLREKKERVTSAGKRTTNAETSQIVSRLTIKLLY